MQLAVSRCRIGAFVRQLAEDIRSDAVGSIAVVNGRFEGNAVRISRYLPSDHNSGSMSTATRRARVPAHPRQLESDF